jgi:hypothetical protein
MKPGDLTEFTKKAMQMRYGGMETTLGLGSHVANKATRGLGSLGKVDFSMYRRKRVPSIGRRPVQVQPNVTSIKKQGS